MLNHESTCWTVIRGAAEGKAPEREEMARRYLGIVRSYLGARWRSVAPKPDIDDAAQEVFLECFRNGGVLENATKREISSFRGFLFGVVRNIARRFEARMGRFPEPTPDSQLAQLQSEEESQSRLFDRTWAQSVMAEAAALQAKRADLKGPEAVQRVELLKLRFEENLPIREIALKWNIPAPQLHHIYALARKEFKTALLDVVAFHYPASEEEVENEASRLLKLLS